MSTSAVRFEDKGCRLVLRHCMHTQSTFALLLASSMRLRTFAPQQPVLVLCSCAFEKLVFVRLDLVITSNRVAQLSGDGAVEECEHNSFQHLHPIYTAAATTLTRSLIRGAVKALVKAENSAQMNDRGKGKDEGQW